MRSKLNLLWAIPWGLFSWLLVEVVIFLPVFLAGLLAVPVLLWSWCATTAESRVNAGQQITIFSLRWTQSLWGNWEDGLAPLWWIQANPGKPMWWVRFTWYLRNPVSNMRFWPVVSTLPSPKVQWCGSPGVHRTLTRPGAGTSGWFVAWQGGYVGGYWSCATWSIWLGWKLNPEDAFVVPCTDYRRDGLGTACQLTRF